MKRLIAASLVMLCAARPADAQDGSSDVLHLVGQADFKESSAGGGGGFDWIHAVRTQSGLDIGAFSGAAADTWWAYGRFGGFTRGRSAIVSGAIDLGGGKEGQKPFGYRRLKGEVAVPALSGRIFLEGEVQFVAMASDDQWVFRGGATLRASQAVTFRASYYALRFADATSPAVSGRVDFDAKRLGGLAGVVFARRAGSTTPIAELGAVPRAAREVFAGVRLRAGSYEVLGVVHVARSGNDANRLLVGLRVPLRPRASEPRTARESSARFGPRP